MLLYVISELINGSQLKASSVSLSGPLIYFISGPYSYTIRRQNSTLSVLKFSNVIILCYVYIVIQCPKIIVRDSFRVSTILNRSFLLVVKCICAGVNLRE